MIRGTRYLVLSLSLTAALGAFGSPAANMSYSTLSKNPNGTVTLSNPRAYVDGRWRKISHYSMSNGICKRFGYAYSAGYDHEMPALFAWLGRNQVVINESGEISEMVSGDNVYVGTVTCVPDNK